ncbi:MAG: formylglycine-generating enzyme family protein [Xenococcus sp. MO_188.B8]|nr:formylglycine-generating enzyme family protein [Xenococcus sp. MO_188.B8]
MAKMRIIKERHRVQHFVEDLNGVPLQMILIPEGKFIMGAPESETDSDERERPQHPVQVSTFFMGRYPITQAQWRAVAAMDRVAKDLNSEPSRFKGDNRPVEQVSWYDAMEFCARLSIHTKKNYRLPSEAEWEYACRSVISGATDSEFYSEYASAPNQSSVSSEELAVEEWNEKYHQPFHFGETISTQLANYDGNSTYGRGEEGDYRNETTAVDFFQVANSFGLSDMHGNVWEWCADPWHEDYRGAPKDSRVWDEQNNNDNHYQNISDNLAELLKDERERILRGGSWYNSPRSCRSAYRYRVDPGDTYYVIGFRVACGGART